jgi:peptide/nickel transport system ATP-binding protein
MAMSAEELRAARLRDIALIPQGAMSSLNPVMRLEDQMVDAIAAHTPRVTKAALDARVVELLKRVGLDPSVARKYPHELSGGMKQRVCIAIAISLRPQLIIADEPTSALDVVVQKQVMTTLLRVQEELGAAILLIGHDMGLMAQVVDRVGIMYAGNFAEVSTVEDLFKEPLHPYSQLLIASLPALEQKGSFQGIPGLPPSLLNRPEGCAFRSRCPRAFERCVVEDPPLDLVRPGREVACHLY